MMNTWQSKILREAEGEGNGGGSSTPDMSFVPEDFHVDGKPDGAKFRAGYDSVLAENAQLKEAQTAAGEGIPENADGYEFALPEGFNPGIEELPADYAASINADDPALADLRSWLHEAGVKQDKVAGLMGVYAKMQARQAAEFNQHMNAQVTELGGKAAFDARMTKLGSALETKLGPDLAKALKASVSTAGAVRALEKLVAPGGGTTREEPAKPAFDGLHGSKLLDAARAQQMAN